MLIKQGKTNIKYLLIVAILAAIVGVGILWCTMKEEVFLTQLPEIKKPKDETADCLKKYPVVVFEDCVPGEVVDGWWGTILYPNTLDTSNIEHYIDAPAPDIVKQAGIAHYGASQSNCQTTWFIKINGEWKKAGQIEFCNYIIDYNSSCNDCLLEWEEGCC